MLPTKLLFLLFLIVLIPILVHPQSLFENAVNDPETAVAEEKETAGDGNSGGTPFSFKLGGKIFAGSIWSWELQEFMSNQAGLNLNVSVNKKDFGRAFANAQVTINEAPEFRLREAWTALYMGPVELTLGEQIVLWGRADGINPTSNFTTLDTSRLDFDPDEARIGNIMARMRLNFSPILLDIIVAPSYRYTILNSAINKYDKEEYNTVLFGARMNIITSPIEGSVSYYNGRVPESGVRLTSAESQIRVAAKQQVLGVDFATVLLGVLGLRGEGAYSWYANEDSFLPEVPRPELEWVVGLDGTLFSHLSIIAQYYGKYVMNWQKNNSVNPVTLQSETLNRLLFGQTHKWLHGSNLSIKANLFSDTFHIEAMGNFNFITEVLQTGIKMTYDITDAFNISGGFMLISSHDGSGMESLNDVYRNIFIGMNVEF